MYQKNDTNIQRLSDSSIFILGIIIGLFGGFLGNALHTYSLSIGGLYYKTIIIIMSLTLLIIIIILWKTRNIHKKRFKIAMEEIGDLIQAQKELHSIKRK